MSGYFALKPGKAFSTPGPEFPSNQTVIFAGSAAGAGSVGAGSAGAASVGAGASVGADLVAAGSATAGWVGAGSTGAGAQADTNDRMSTMVKKKLNTFKFWGRMSISFRSTNRKVIND
jgi:hypothetical protein